ncbi:hypothetical protein [Desulfoglaeba alkanexedens]|jgi:hypothetical protein|uniref:hypothetical protein n=1 Tax=Desulfoglaeba alkanexedens TaxID=361111 RepID=UPI00147778F3|nr:hypothetical protein [Desulfoglaeba alkanexedens]
MRKSDDRAFHFVGFGKKTDDDLDLLRQMERFAVACVELDDRMIRRFDGEKTFPKPSTD